MDLFNRLTTQERVRLVQPATRSTDVLFSYPIDLLAYRDVVEGFTDLGGGNYEYEGEQPGPGSPVPAWQYFFSSAQTQVEHATVGVFTYVPPPPVGTIALGVKPITSLLGDALPEKRWIHGDNPVTVQSSHTPANALYPAEQVSLDTRTRLKGRLSHSIAYPHQPFGAYWRGTPTGYDFTEANEAVHYRFNSYHADGNVAWEIQQFNHEGISPGAPGMLVHMAYPAYDLRGNLRTQNIDVHMDGVLDVRYLHTYDDRGRPHRTYASHDALQNGGELLAEHTYDESRGVLSRTTYHRKCGLPQEIGATFEVDRLDYAHDLRDRLTSISSRFYDHQLYYDDATPGNGTLAGARWSGLINGTRSTWDLSTLYQPPSPNPFSQPTTYGYRYDSMGRLTRADARQGDAVTGQPAGSPYHSVGDEAYSYDRIGNLGLLYRRVLPTGGPVETHSWTYAYQTATNRLLQVQAVPGTAASTRAYTYDNSGNLLTDDSKGLVQTYGRGHLPTTYLLNPSEGEMAGSYLYDAADARLYKYLNRDALHLPHVNEFYLRDVRGHEVGILDMNGQVGDDATAKWTWYGFSPARFARVKPLAAQQPANYSASMGLTEMADQTTSDHGTLRTLLYAASLQGGVEYPATYVRVTHPTTGARSWYKLEEYSEAIGVDTLLATYPAKYFTFDGPRTALWLRSSTIALDSVNIKAEDLILEGESRGAPPWVVGGPWTTHANTRLDEVTYYVHDHLGNTRVTHTYDCKDVNANNVYDAGDGLLEGLYDYYPYGKQLRMFEAGVGEKYLTTHHQRDGETGLDYRGARYYDGDVARFLSLDPVQADYPNWSPYNHVLGNPASLVDAEGEEPGCACPTPPCGEVVQRLEAMYEKVAGPIREVRNEAMTALENGVNSLGNWLNGWAGDGGYNMTDDYAKGSNNADRKGKPSSNWDVTAIKARAEASFGPEKLTSRMIPGHREGWVGNLPEFLSSASGVVGTIWDPLSPGAPQSPAPVLVEVSIDSVGDSETLLNVVLSTRVVEVSPKDTAGGVLNGDPKRPVTPNRTQYQHP